MPHTDLPEGPSIQLAISNAIVRLYKDQLGRGPTKSRTNWAGPDIIICTLEQSMTPAEQSLVHMGEHGRLRDTRMFFQYATEPEFRAIVEGITGRKVRAFVSGIDTKHDVSVEVFYLEPRSDGGDPRMDGPPRMDGGDPRIDGGDPRSDGRKPGLDGDGGPPAS